MSRIHYFQRYSSKENVVTNSTLHLLAQIGAHSNARLRQLLGEIFNDQEIPLGINFEQQVRASVSVPDGIIWQEPLRIAIETKVDASVDVDQLTRHCESFSQGRLGNYLLLLTCDEIPDDALSVVYQKARSFGITFQHFTFEKLCRNLKANVHPHESGLMHVVEDYLLYCSDMGLLPDRRIWMRIVPCGQTMDSNVQWEVYFQPTERGYSHHDFIGLYKDKAVRHVGKIACIFDYVEADPPPHGTVVFGENSPGFLRRIQGIVRDTKTSPGWDVSSGHRFFCVDKFIPTLFEKASWGGIQGARFYDVSKLAEPPGDVSLLATKLKTLTWE
jgi:hypothetical protein